jgi:4-hydroxy-2-oxoglutarate aldolase
MIKGIFPPIATPFTNDEVAYSKLIENLGRWNETELAGYVVLGSNGESVFLTRDEKIKLVETVKNNIPKNKKLIAGTGSDSIKATISLTNEAADCGADFALILTPSFFKDEMKHDVFLKYYFEVAERSTIPVIIYNVPKFTGVNIQADTVAKLAEHPNIIGIKNSAENLAHFGEIIYKTPKNFSCIVGTASVLFPGLTLGASGGILALANIAPNECIQIQKLFEKGKMNEAAELQKSLIDVNKAITSKYGVAGLKAALDLIGFYGGLPRSPLKGLNDTQIEDLKSILSEANIKVTVEN